MFMIHAIYGWVRSLDALRMSRAPSLASWKAAAVAGSSRGVDARSRGSGCGG